MTAEPISDFQPLQPNVGLYAVSEADSILDHCTTNGNDVDISITRESRSIAGSTVALTRFTPDQMTDSTRIFINGGWCAPPEGYFDFARGLAQHGRDVSVIHPPRRQSLRYMAQGNNFKDVLRLQSQANWVFMRDINDEIDIVVHSMGLIVGTRTAKEKPGHIRSISASGGAGLDGPHSVSKMILRCLSSVSELDKRTSSLALKTFSHVRSDPLRVIREGIQTATTDLREDIAAGREQGTKFGAFLFGKDRLFKPDTVIAYSSDYLDQHYTVAEASHNYPIREPFVHAHQQAAGLEKLNAPAPKIA